MEGGQPKAKQGEKASAAKLEHPQRFVEAIEETIGVKKQRDRTFTQESGSVEQPTMCLEFPCLVIDIPSLYVFNPVEGRLRETNWIVLGLHISGASGPAFGTIDVITKSFIPDYIRKLDDVIESFAAFAKRDVHRLLAARAEEIRSGRTISVPRSRR